MSASALFDISTIDCCAVAVAADEVGRLNPQSGDMRMLDHVIWHSPDFKQLLGVRQARENEFWVPGHIPGRPLLPGVLMIEASAQLASIAFRLRTNEARFLAFTRVDDLTFRAQVVPGDTLYLLCQEIRFQPRRFQSRVQGLVDDHVAFEGTITGMVVNEDQGRGKVEG
ncbi:MAG: 3-hydroxyacyl-ACP dehydratase FabZ family protein [Phycisphaerales bacterium]